MTKDNNWETKSNRHPYFLGLGRAMVSLGPYGANNAYCPYKCKFCYVNGPFNKYKQATETEIYEWVQSKKGKFDTVYVSGDTDSFAFPRTNQGLKLLSKLSESNLDVLFTTRHVFDNEQSEFLGKIADKFRQKNNLLIGCVSVCQTSHPKLEPHPIASPEERINQLANWKQLGITTVLAIRPFIRGVEPKNYSNLVRMGSRFSDVIIGGDLYADKKGVISKKIMSAVSNWNPDFTGDHVDELDFTDSTRNWYHVTHPEAEDVVRKECKLLGIDFFMRSKKAVDFIKNHRDHFISGTNLKAASGGYLSSIAEQIECVKTQIFDDADHHSEGSSQFFAEHILNHDFKPKINSKRRDKSELIDPKNLQFIGAHKALQEELEALLCSRFGQNWSDGNNRAENLVKDDISHLSLYFGSTSAGWDAMVEMKAALLSNNIDRNHRAGWLTTTMALAGNILRDLVRITILNMGGVESVKDAIRFSLQDIEDNQFENFEKLSQQEIADYFTNYMRKSLENTFIVSIKFFRSLQPDSAEQLKSRETMIARLIDLGASSNAIFRKLIHLMNEGVYSKQYSGLHMPFRKQIRDDFDAVMTWDSKRIRLVVQFIFSICAESAIIGLKTVLVGYPTQSKLNLTVPILDRKSKAELRVFILLCLKNNKFWMAWFLSEATDLFLTEQKGTMLKLNAAYASKKLSELDGLSSLFDSVTFLDYDPNWEGRYKLLWKSIFDDFSDLTDVLEDASKSMSREEFMEWPALEYVRRNPAFKKFIDNLT